MMKVECLSDAVGAFWDVGYDKVVVGFWVCLALRKVFIFELSE